MYLLILNVLFMFLDTTISKELFDETVVDISSYIIEILQIGLCVYWGKKKGITNLFFEKDYKFNMKNKFHCRFNNTLLSSYLN